MTNKYNISHIALIMDGNRRWAKEHKLPSFEGHRRGENCIEPIIDYSIELGIPYLTFWAFSTENWKRSKKEVSYLLKLFRFNLDKKIKKFHKKNVKLNVIGNLSLFPEDLQKKTKNWMEKTKKNNAITVNMALSYGGRDEIIRAVNKWHNNARMQECKNAKFTLEGLENYLDTKGQPNPDLLIRTGGEHRLSGFMLWQLEYCELYFTETLWPEFTQHEFQKALDEFEKRQRRFGG